MIQNIITIAVSVSISLCLLSSDQSVSDFGFYVAVTINVLAWIGVIAGFVKEAEAKQIRRSFLIMLPSTFFSIYAAIASGHPMLAASAAIISFLIASRAFASK